MKKNTLIYLVVMLIAQSSVFANKLDPRSLFIKSSYDNPALATTRAGGFFLSRGRSDLNLKYQLDETVEKYTTDNYIGRIIYTMSIDAETEVDFFLKYKKEDIFSKNRNLVDFESETIYTSASISLSNTVAIGKTVAEFKGIDSTFEAEINGDIWGVELCLMCTDDLVIILGYISGVEKIYKNDGNVTSSDTNADRSVNGYNFEFAINGEYVSFQLAYGSTTKDPFEVLGNSYDKTDTIINHMKIFIGSLNFKYGNNTVKSNKMQIDSETIAIGLSLGEYINLEFKSLMGKKKANSDVVFEVQDKSVSIGIKF